MMEVNCFKKKIDFNNYMLFIDVVHLGKKKKQSHQSIPRHFLRLSMTNSIFKNSNNMFRKETSQLLR